MKDTFVEELQKTTDEATRGIILVDLNEREGNRSEENEDVGGRGRGRGKLLMTLEGCS
jgi:hypothetical protein